MRKPRHTSGNANNRPRADLSPFPDWHPLVYVFIGFILGGLLFTNWSSEKTLPEQVATTASKTKVETPQPKLDLSQKKSEPLAQKPATKRPDAPPLPMEEEAAKKPENPHEALNEDAPKTDQIIEPSEVAHVPAEPIDKNLARTIHDEIKRNETLSTSFSRVDVSADKATEIVQALKGTFNLRHLKPGNKWELKLNVLGEIDAFTLYYTTLLKYYVRREGEALVGYKIEGETTRIVESISGIIENSLSMSLWKLGESDVLTTQIADIFAWDIDFYSDIRKGDSWRVLVEKFYYEGKFVKYGQVLAAYFHGSYLGDQYAYYFEESTGGRTEYFDNDGNALQKSFLKAPLNTTRVTSKFGFRMHPTLGKYKRHNGVDYGAPRGTPVWAIASAKVLGAGWMGACGKGVKLRHMNGYETVYCHLSSIAVTRGQRVNQKQMIGRVGSTGRSTGPHLHFGVKKRGAWMNPLKLKYEPGKPVGKKHKDRFHASRAMLREKLDKIPLPVFYGPILPPDYEDPTADRKQTAKRSRSVKKTRRPKKSQGFRPRPEGIKVVPQGG